MIRISCLSFRRCDWNLKADAQRLVLLAWLFPSIIFGGTYRPATLAKTGWEKGWRFAVFAGPAPEPSNEAGTVLLRKLPVSAEIHRASSDRVNARSLFFPRIDGGTFRLVFETVLNIIGALDRIRPALVMATGPPFHNFVVATLVARYFRCALVLEYRDEWTECPFHFVRLGPFDRRMECWCLRSEDRVILTTESQRVHLLKTFPEISPSDCVVIPNGYDADDLPSMPFNRSKPREKIYPFVLSYLGLLGDHV
jgi:glycosyltransferase involved in cell wall biosynthesis